MNGCTHTTRSRRYVEEMDDWTGETTGRWESYEEGTTEDISIGAYRCTQCGAVGYYTGGWRNHYEKGTPCIGDDSPNVNLQKVAQARKAKA